MSFFNGSNSIYIVAVPVNFFFVSFLGETENFSSRKSQRSVPPSDLEQRQLDILNVLVAVLILGIKDQSAMLLGTLQIKLVKTFSPLQLAQSSEVTANKKSLV